MAMERATVVGIFTDRSDAERAIEALHAVGFTDDEIGFAMRGSAGAEGATSAEVGHTGEGAMGGVIAGAGVGGLLAAAAAALIFPGFGPVVAGGILAAVLHGAAIGAVAGGFLGVLKGMGVPEEEAQYYEREFEAGHILIMVKADARSREAREVLDSFGGFDMLRHRAAAA